MQPSVKVNALSKCYKLGTIGRQTLVDEVRYWWLKIRGRDPKDYFRKIGHSAKEIRRIEAESAGHNRFWALKDVSFEAQPGEVVGIIGRNGAGKSTLLKVLGRITEPTSGDAVLNGRVASLLEVGTGFHPELTGRENIYMNGAILGMKRDEINRKLDEIVAFSELEKFIDTPVKRYSNGMHVRLAFAVAAHLEPEILLVDEVLAVGDMEYQKKCMGKMHDISKSGRTVLFVSHNMPVVSRLCSRAFLLNQGQIACRGSADEVVKQYLQTSLQSAAHRQWTEDQAPGIEGFKLLSVSLVDAAGKPAGTVNIQQPFSVRIEYAVRGEGLNFRSMARFYTQGVCAFPVLEQHNFNHQKEGRYVTRLTIPANLLAEGEYILSVSFFGSKGRKYNYCESEDVISFLVVDYLQGESARGDFAANLEGVMRPMATWEKEYVG